MGIAQAHTVTGAVGTSAHAAGKTTFGLASHGSGTPDFTSARDRANVSTHAEEPMTPTLALAGAADTMNPTAQEVRDPQMFEDLTHAYVADYELHGYRSITCLKPRIAHLRSLSASTASVRSPTMRSGGTRLIGARRGRQRRA